LKIVVAIPVLNTQEMFRQVLDAKSVLQRKGIFLDRRTWIFFIKSRFLNWTC